MKEQKYSEYLKQFKTEIAKEIDVDIDAQKNPTKALPVSSEEYSPHMHTKKR